MTEWQEIGFEECVRALKIPKKIPKKKYLEEGEFPIISQEGGLINGYWNSQKDLIKLDKPIIGFGDHNMIVKYIDFDFVYGADGLKLLEPIKELFPRFFFYLISSISISSLGYARHYRLLKENPISFPSLAEQKGIVRTLDKAFVAIDKAIENTRRNLNNIDELKASTLNAEIAPQKNQQQVKLGEWQEIGFEECVRALKIPKKIPKKKYLEEGEFPIISQEGGLINGYWNSQKDLIKLDKPIIGFGDHNMIVKYIDFDFVYGADGLKLLEPIKELFPRFFFYLISSISISSLGYARHYRLLKENPISFPPLAEQKKIVAKLDKAFTALDSLQKNYKSRLDHYQNLKKSLLQSLLTPPKRKAKLK